MNDSRFWLFEKLLQNDCLKDILTICRFFELGLNRHVSMQIFLKEYTGSFHPILYSMNISNSNQTYCLYERYLTSQRCSTRLTKWLLTKQILNLISSQERMEATIATMTEKEIFGGLWHVAPGRLVPRFSILWKSIAFFLVCSGAFH